MVVAPLTLHSSLRNKVRNLFSRPLRDFFLQILLTRHLLRGVPGYSQSRLRRS